MIILSLSLMPLLDKSFDFGAEIKDNRGSL